MAYLRLKGLRPLRPSGPDKRENIHDLVIRKAPLKRGHSARKISNPADFQSSLPAQFRIIEQ